MKRTEESLRDIWDNIKCTHICITGVQEGEERGRENTWKAYNQKFPKYGEGNSHSSGRNTGNSIQNKPQKKYSNEHINQTDKNLVKRKKY